MATPAQQRAAASDAAGVQAARENRRVRKRTDLMQRAEASIVLALDALSHRERCTVLNSVLTEALHEWRQQDPNR